VVGVSDAHHILFLRRQKGSKCWLSELEIAKKSFKSTWRKLDF